MKTFNRYVLLGRRERLLTLSLVLLSLLPISSFAVEIQVPSQYPTIQAAIDASLDGDVIIVQPGTYAENINFNGKAITLTSTNPLDPTIVANTIIDGSMNGSVITFDSSETSNSVLTGFTIRNGSGTLIDGKRYGGGIYCGLRSTPTIRHNKIVNNTADFGGGIYIHGNSPPVITNGPNSDYPYANKSQIVGLSVTATDPDGDSLIYRWVPREGGTITGTGATVSFSAATAGVYHIDLTVDDQHGGKATGVVTVTVIGIAIQAIPQLKVGQSASISAVAAPPVANSPQYPVSITWSLTEGPAVGTFDAAVNGTPGATSINFTPSASGPGQIQVTYQVGIVSTTHSVAIALNPIVLSIDPASGIQNTTVQPVLTGNNLGRVSSVSLSGSGVAVTIRDGKTENSLPVQFVIDKEAAAGNRTISLITPENTFSTSLTFQIVALPPITANPTSLNIVVGNTGPIVFSVPDPAPAGGVTLNLSSSAATVATVPASATIPQGQTSVQVNVTAVAYGTATITADTSTYSKVQATVNVTNVPLITYSPSPLTVPLGVATQCAVNISNPAPTGGLVVTLSGGTGVIGIPATVTIPASQKSAAFSVQGLAEGTVTVTATATGYPSADLQVNVQISAPGFLYRKAITIDHTKVSATVSNFPVLVSIPNDNDLKNHGSSPSGYDIVFIDSTGTLLDHEMEKWDGATGTLVAWVRIPSLSSTSDTVISMLYGNTDVTTSQENKTGVWDSNFVGVWHLKDPTNPTDSTSNGNNGTNYGATGAAGKIDGAGSFDGTNDYISFNQSALENVFASGSPWTISLWVMPGRNPASWEWIWCKAYTSHNDPYYQIDLREYPPNTIGAYIWSTSYYGTGAYLSQAATLASGVWSKVDIVGQGGGTSPFLSLYVNGNLIGTNTSPKGSYAHYSTPITLGMDANIIGSYYAFAGSIDESRISNVARSADWILTEYKNQSSPSIFYTVGSEGLGGPVNHAPVAQNQSVTTNQDTAKAITLVATDADGDALSYQIVAQPAHGALSGTPPNVTYTPAAGYVGSDGFTFKANDGMADSNVATISIVAQVSVPGFLYRKAITIDHTKVSATLLDFPVLVSIASDNDLKNHVSSPSGYDIVFIGPSGTLLDYEMEKWDGATGTLVAWVRIPSLSSTSDTVISMLYGNTGVTTSQENKTGVWDSNFKGVWHLPNGITLNTAASNSGGNSFTVNGVTATGGQVDGAANFVRSSSTYLSQASDSNNNISGDITVSLWFYPTYTLGSGEYCTLVHKDSQYSISIFSNGISWADGTNWSYANFGYYNIGIQNNVWQHLVVTKTGTTVSVYLNGLQQLQKSFGSSGVSSGINALFLGTYNSQAGSSGFYGGEDEVRLSNITRSADWILTEYRNQSSPSTFCTIGSEEQIGPPVNHAPVAQNQSVSTNQDTAKAITLVATHPDGDPLTYQIVAQPGHGTLSGTPPNLTYTPAAGYSGSDIFTFKANDGMTDSNVATISISVVSTTNFKPYAMETDGSYLYFSGIGYVGALTYFRIEKRDLNGNLVDQFDQAIPSAGSLSTLKLDNSSIYVGGYRTEAGVEKAIIQRRDKNNLSSQFWEYVYSGSNWEVRDLVLLGDGVYFSGAGLGGTPVIKGKLNQSDGTQVWVFTNTQTASDGISTDGSFIYLHKRTSGVTTIEKVDPTDGSVLATTGYSAGNFSKGQIVDGYLYVAGNLNTLGVLAQALIEKVIPAGDSQWQTAYPTVPGSTTNIYDQAICDGSDVYVVGRAPLNAPGPIARIARHSVSNGAETWGVNYPTTTKASYAIFCQLGAYLYVAGWDGDPAKQCFWLEKRNKLDGSLVWARQ